MKKIYVLYLYLYRAIKEKSKGRPFISHRNIMEIFKRRLYRFPHPLHYLVIKEMQELKLIKKVGRTNNITYELIGKDIDKQLNKYDFFP